MQITICKGDDQSMFINWIRLKKSWALTEIKFVISPTVATLRDVVDKRKLFL